MTRASSVVVALVLMLAACGGEYAPTRHQEPGGSLACPAALCTKEYPYCCGGVCWDLPCEVP